MMYYLYWLNSDGLLQPVLADKARKSYHWCDTDLATAKAAAAWLFENKRTDSETAVIVSADNSLAGTLYGIDEE